MAYREILRILSSYLYLFAALLCIPLLLAAYYQFRIEFGFHPQPHATAAFGLTCLLCLVLAWLCGKGAATATSFIYRQREALISAVLIWFLTPAIGALPFIFTGTVTRFDQAYFEAASGFTTTGATILEAKKFDPHTGKEIPIRRTYPGIKEIEYQFYGTIDPVKDPVTGVQMEGIEAVSRALLFWRSFMQWIGGMGVIVLFVAFLPELGIKGKFLFQTEAPGPLKEGFKPRIKETALQLWKIYVRLTLAQVILLLLFDRKMSLFDAVTLAFSTLSTGGFSVHTANVGYYDSAAVEWILLLFMILGSVNFALYYAILKGKLYRLFDAQLICFLAILGTLGLLTSWQIWGTHNITPTGEAIGNYSFSEALRIGLFQLTSAQTSTGFFISDYDLWPSIVQAILLVSMFLGGMSGSTAGGMKIIRLQILFQFAKRKIESLFHPKKVTITRIGDKEIDASTGMSVLCFFFIVISLSVLATLIYIWDQVDPETALGLTTCMVNNTGLAFRAGGAVGSMAFLSPFSNYLSAFLMIIGRLEFFAVLALCFPSFWKETA